ncbi:nuclear transport factor 2 family protein [Ichthyenterobacterium sp. W332]|uniref:Nuclear transport factor 2 family protein n=1 Tax=Microcosmobacter mediterraneus TaxID=3075607 RepID=A0ABU2YLV4_9FLAO|nr:nuclear transport factor 2 family protein [Ichthyenterobacterium sp. W332]MDT0559134.1 nuclear transport factor 2 family protein [Ichthyenterobacterium sp. W332]
MKSRFLLLLLFLSFSFAFAQPNTEVFLFDLEVKNGKYTFTKGKNISNNEGYDNQPSFVNDNQILFASTRGGQTDIVSYRANYDTKTWVNFTEGGEYTPLKIPKKNAVSAVRLDKDGKQRLYSYSLSNGESTELISDLVVAYYTWYDEHTVVSAVIEEQNLNLYVSNIKEGWNRKYATNVGRSFHKIPNSNLVSFISKENATWTIKSLNPVTGDTKVIANTIKGVEDMCWLINGDMLMGKDNKLYKLTINKDNNWKEIIDLSEYGIKNISRITGNSISNKLLVAAEIGALPTSNEENTDTESVSNSDSNSTSTSDVESIVQRNLDAYNARDIDAFMKDYADNVKLYAYPNTLQTEGKKAMREGYLDWFERTPDLNAFIKKRIVIGNKVIDEEQVTANGQIFNAVAIYEVENGKIIKVTFIQ